MDSRRFPDFSPQQDFGWACNDSIIGLSEGEIAVYLANLKLGLSSVGPIIKESRLQSSAVYHILDSLKDRGIIAFETKNNIKYFYPVSPERLLDLIEQKKELKVELDRIDDFKKNLENDEIFQKYFTQNKDIDIEIIELEDQIKDLKKILESFEMELRL